MYSDWLSYFQSNQNHFDHISTQEIESLTVEESKIIQRSLQQFQKGENSEGKHLYHFAKNWGNQEYFECIKLFIKEEQTHARVLGAFMKNVGIPKIKSHWVDSVFRSLRKWGGLENSIDVLLTAEVIAAIYYKALHNATKNRQLRAICNRILVDEEMHINFQSKTLSHFHLGKAVPFRFASVIKKRILMMGTMMVVWIFHRKVYRAGKFNLVRYVQETWNEYLRSEQMQRGKSYILIREEGYWSLS